MGATGLGIVPGIGHPLGGRHGLPRDLPPVVADALVDPVMANTPRPPGAADVHRILADVL